MMIQHCSGAQTETAGGGTQSGSTEADHSQCVSDRPAWCCRPAAAAAAAGERVELAGLRSVLPETQLQTCRLHVECLTEVTTHRLLVGKAGLTSRSRAVPPPAVGMNYSTAELQNYRTTGLQNHSFIQLIFSLFTYLLLWMSFYVFSCYEPNQDGS